MGNEDAVEPRKMRADAAERARQAWLLRLAGHDWESIADAIGYAHGTNAARAAKRHADGLPNPDRNEMRQLLRSRAEWLWRETRKDVESRRSGAGRAAVALLARMSAFEGADTPTKVEITPNVVEFESVVQRMVAQVRGEDGDGPVEVDVVAVAEIDTFEPDDEAPDTL